MSEIPNVATAADSAATTRFETVEIRGVEACDDGSYNVTLNVAGIKDAPTYQETDADETGSQDWVDHPEHPDPNPREDPAGAEADDDDHHPDAGGTDGIPTRTVEDRTEWQVEGRYLSYNELQKMVGNLEIPYPDDTSGENLAETLKTAASGTESDGQDSEDEPDKAGEADTPASGGSGNGQKRTTDEGRTKWKVEGRWMGYNGLQKAISKEQRKSLPDSKGDTLAEALRGDESGSTGSDEDDPESGVPSQEELIELGVKPDEAATVQRYRKYNGCCEVENCPYGANKGSDRCYDHEDTDVDRIDPPKKSTAAIEVSYEDLTEGQKRAARDLVSENEDMDLKEAVQKV